MTPPPPQQPKCLVNSVLAEVMTDVHQSGRARTVVTYRNEHQTSVSNPLLEKYSATGVRLSSSRKA